MLIIDCIYEGLFRYHENRKLVEYSKTDEYVVNPSYSYWDLAKQFARLQVNMKFHSVYLGMTGNEINAFKTTEN